MATVRNYSFNAVWDMLFHAAMDRVCHNEGNPRPCLKPPIRL